MSVVSMSIVLVHRASSGRIKNQNQEDLGQHNTWTKIRNLGSNTLMLFPAKTFRRNVLQRNFDSVCCSFTYFRLARVSSWSQNIGNHLSDMSAGVIDRAQCNYLCCRGWDLLHTGWMRLVWTYNMICIKTFVTQVRTQRSIKAKLHDMQILVQ